MRPVTLVTGGCGYIGSHVVYALLDRGHVPVIVDDLSLGNRLLVPIDVPIYCFDYGNITMMREVLSRFKPAHIIHLAAFSDVAESMEKPNKYYRNNVASLVDLVDICELHGVRNFIFASSAAVYGGRLTGERFTEDSLLQPCNTYGYTKVFGENILASARNINSVSLHFFNVAGADAQLRCGEINASNHIIKRAALAAIGRVPSFKLYGTDYPTQDGTCIRDYIHVSDIASAHLAAIDKLEATGGKHVYNLGLGKGFSNYEVIAEMKSVSGVDFSVNAHSRRDGDPPVLIADNSKALSELNWFPHVNTLHRICKSALDWEYNVWRGAPAPTFRG